MVKTFDPELEALRRGPPQPGHARPLPTFDMAQLVDLDHALGLAGELEDEETVRELAQGTG